MIRVKRRTDYAVRILVALARHSADAFVSGARLQVEAEVPQAFFRRIVAELAHLDFLETASGPHGGMRLARPAAEITLRQVVESLEGPIALSECMLPEGCPLGEPCPAGPWWQSAQQAMLAELEAASLERIAAGILPHSDGRA